MPLYTFKNKLTNQEYDEIMSYEDLKEYLKQEHIQQVFKMNICRYSDNNGAKDQFTEWARDPNITGNGGFKTYGKARTDYDKRQDDKEKIKINPRAKREIDRYPLVSVYWLDICSDSLAVYRII